MPALYAIARDLRHAVRSLSKARAFTFVCVGSLGVGIGTVMAILMIVRAIIGTPPGLDTNGFVEVLVRPQGQLLAQTGHDIESWTYPDFTDLSAANPGMALTAWTFGDTVLRISDAGDPLRVPVMYASPNYFTTIGVPLARGTGFAAVRDDGSSPPVVIIDHHLWQDRFGSRPDIVGTTITLNRVVHTIVGVTPERFRGHLSPEGSPDVQLWAPLHQHARLQGAGSLRHNREADWVRVVGRLSPGVSLVQANAAVSAVMAGLAQQHPSTNQLKSAVVEPYHPLGALARPEAIVAQSIFYGLSGMVLLIVCLNVSGMMAVRTATRERELSVRVAIGASRARLMQYILAEALLLALLGGALAVFLIFGIPATLLWWFEFWHRDLDLFKPDVWTYLTAVGLCFLTSVVFGLLPAIRFSRPSLVSALKDDAGGGGRRVGRAHRLTAAIQAGIAVPFLVIGGVKLDQVRTAAAADVGFAPAGLFVARADLSGAGRPGVPATPSVLLKQVTQSLGEAAGVSSVTAADGIPLDFRARIVRVFREGDATPVRAHTTRVDEHFFDTLKIRVARGRGITREDVPGAALVVVLSQTLAAQLFPGEEAIGKRLTFALQASAAETAGPSRQTLKPEGPASPVFTVVGVTDDVVTSQMGTERPQMFVPLAQHPAESVVLVARATAPQTSMATSFKNAVAVADPDFAASSMTTGERLIRRSVVDLATHSAMAVLCAGVALTLAALGVYGVVGFMVATRTREIGVRMALGASRPRVLRTVLADAIKVVAPGVILGLVLSVVLIRVSNLPETWYALGGIEPLAYAASAAVALGVALVAGLPSARRAIKINPIQAMRSE